VILLMEFSNEGGVSTLDNIPAPTATWLTSAACSTWKAHATGSTHTTPATFLVREGVFTFLTFCAAALRRNTRVATCRKNACWFAGCRSLPTIPPARTSRALPRRYLYANAWALPAEELRFAGYATAGKGYAGLEAFVGIHYDFSTRTCGALGIPWWLVDHGWGSA